MRLLLAALFLAGCGTGTAETVRDPEGTSAGATEIVTAGRAFTCTPTMLWDGDGPIHCAEGPRVRLSGIAAREMDGSCRPGHPCPDASAEAARDQLASLLGQTIGTGPDGHLLIEGPPLACTSLGSAGGKRIAAWCVSPLTGDLSCAMVASGVVSKWGRYWRGHRCGGQG